MAILSPFYPRTMQVQGQQVANLRHDFYKLEKDVSKVLEAVVIAANLAANDLTEDRRQQAKFCRELSGFLNQLTVLHLKL